MSKFPSLKRKILGKIVAKISGLVSTIADEVTTWDQKFSDVLSSLSVIDNAVTEMPSAELIAGETDNVENLPFLVVYNLVHEAKNMVLLHISTLKIALELLATDHSEGNVVLLKEKISMASPLRRTFAMALAFNAYVHDRQIK